MARYIDIEGAGIGKANREQFLVPEFADGWNAVLKILDNEPTADVVEVKHGEWKPIVKQSDYLEPPYCDTCECTVCGYWIDVCETVYNYCPNCGAKMDGLTKIEHNSLCETETYVKE